MVLVRAKQRKRGTGCKYRQLTEVVNVEDFLMNATDNGGPQPSKGM